MKIYCTFIRKLALYTHLNPSLYDSLISFQPTTLATGDEADDPARGFGADSASRTSP